MSEWTDERRRELDRLWREGLSTAQIGTRLGISKNAVVGVAHRMGLPARGSPIKHLPDGERPPPRPTAPTLAELVPLASLGQAAP